MRNVVATSASRRGAALQGGKRSEAVAVDPITNRVYVASSSSSKLDDDESPLVDLDIWQVGEQESMQRLSSFAAPKAPRFKPLPKRETREGWASLKEEARNEVVSLDYLADGGEFVRGSPAFVHRDCRRRHWSRTTAGSDRGGDALSPILPEIVGSVQQGILAAAWSPDDELLVLVTDTTPSDLADDRIEKGPSLIVMTREFEVLSEAVLRTDDFGEGESA
ncbi:hypothetical protein L7F22_015884 [Adiantum nelumboides]|nr:hypothetical protein [Adiantum nelumboides]